MSALFNELQVGKTTIKNRIVVPPMVCFKYSDDQGFVSEGHVAHYEALAKGGAGLIIVEATCVLPEGRLSMDQMGLWRDEQVEGMKTLVEVCHKHGAKVMVQLHHAGGAARHGRGHRRADLGREADDHAAARAGTHGRALRPANHVRRWWSG